MHFMMGSSIIIISIFVVVEFARICTTTTLTNFQVVHFLDPSQSDTLYYSSWNSDQWVKWLRDKFYSEAEAKRQSGSDGEPDFSASNDNRLKGSWVNIVIPATREDFSTAYASGSVNAYTDPQKSDYVWSDYAFPVYVIIRSPNATLNITEGEAETPEEHRSHQRLVYGYNVYNCAEKKMFVNAKIDSETLEPIHFQTFFPKKVKNPKDKLRIPLSVCTKISQTRGLLDEIQFQLRSTTSKAIELSSAQQVNSNTETLSSEQDNEISIL